jgi:cytoskeletal protein RodZ
MTQHTVGAVSATVGCLPSMTTENVRSKSIVDRERSSMMQHRSLHRKLLHFLRFFFVISAASGADSTTATLPLLLLQQQQQAPLSSEVLVTNTLGVAVTLAGVMPWSVDEASRMGAQATAAAARASPRRGSAATVTATTTSDGASVTAAATTAAAAAVAVQTPAAAVVQAPAPTASPATAVPEAAAAAAVAAAAAAVVPVATAAATQWHEGFLCPDCHCDLGSPDALLCHYMEEHSHSTSASSVNGATISSWTHGEY